MAKRVIKTTDRYSGGRAIPVKFIEDGDQPIEGGSLTPIQIIPASDVEDVIGGEPTSVYLDTTGKIIGDKSTLTKVYIPTDYLLLDKFNTKEGFSVDLSDGNHHFDPSTVSAAVAGGVSGDAASFNGTSEYINIYSIEPDFNESAGSVIVYGKVDNVGVWSDGTERALALLYADGNNWVGLHKITTGSLRWVYKAGGIVKQITKTVTTTGYFHIAITWDSASDEVIAYYNGSQEGSIQTGLGTWVGSLNASITVLGANNVSAGNPWHGLEDLARVYNRVLTPTEISEHYNSGAGLPYPDMTAEQKLGCILAYDFDKIGSEFALDSSPQGNDFDQSTVSLDAGGGVAGSDAARFNGTSEYIEIPVGIESSFNPNSGTIFLFNKLTSAQWSDGNVRRFVTLQDSVSSDFFTIDKNGIRYRAKCNAVFDAHTEAYSGTSWSSIMITWNWDGVNTNIQCGLNGGVVNSFSIAQQFQFNNLTNGRGFGYNGSPVPAMLLDGLEDLARIYDRALTPAEFLELHNSGNGLPYRDMSGEQRSGCILAYDFDTGIRAAEPGPGEWTVYDTANHLSISGGNLVVDGNGASWADPRIVSVNSFDRVAGRALFGGFVSASSLNSFIGWNEDNIPAAYDQCPGGAYSQQGLVCYSYESSFGLGTTTWSTTFGAAPTRSALVLRSSGFFHFVLVSGEWIVMRVANRFGTTPLWPVFSHSHVGGARSIKPLSVVDLPTPFDSDYGIATDRVAGVVAAGTTFVHEADCIIEYTVTAIPSSGNIKLQFRLQDANNRLEVQCGTGGIVAYKFISGTPTQIGSLGTSPNGGDRIVIVADGTSVKVYVANILRITGTVSEFATETNGSLISVGVGGSVSDIVTWPRTLSGSALAAIEAV